MPACKKRRETQALFLLIAVSWLAGCSQPSADFGFRIEQIETEIRPEGILVVIQQKMTLSEDARDALNHGVPLIIQTEARLLRRGSLSPISQNTLKFSIKYLPLSNRYQLSFIDTEDVITRPRRRHVMAELSTVELRLPITGKPGGDLEVRVRSHLLKEALPAPMRLPVLFSRHWKHDTGWHSAPVSATADKTTINIL